MEILTAQGLSAEELASELNDSKDDDESRVDSDDEEEVEDIDLSKMSLEQGGSVSDAMKRLSDGDVDDDDDDRDSFYDSSDDSDDCDSTELNEEDDEDKIKHSGDEDEGGGAGAEEGSKQDYMEAYMVRNKRFITLLYNIIHDSMKHVSHAHIPT
jgi:hypothetical protein